MPLPRSVEWDSNNTLKILDQRVLPEKVSFVLCQDGEQVAGAIESMVVRGAPAIGIAASYGVVLEAPQGEKGVFEIIDRLKKTRPTAVNLFWALKRMKRLVAMNREKDLFAALLREAHAICQEDLDSCMAIGDFGSSLIPDNGNILTHCNAGALATAGHGTALGVIRSAVAKGKKVHVYADETRPLLQGARLTLWELEEDHIPVTLITDGMGAFLMARKGLDAVVVGADRITARGDVANKIGTYGLALGAKYHHVPFYVAAPSSTFDMTLCKGEDIPIEERSPEEVRSFGSSSCCRKESSVWNPAFDITPGELVGAIITEKGIAYPPYEESLKKILQEK